MNANKINKLLNLFIPIKLININSTALSVDIKLLKIITL